MLWRSYRASDTYARESSMRRFSHEFWIGGKQARTRFARSFGSQ